MTKRHLLPGCCTILALASACSKQEPPKVAEPPMTPAAASVESREAPKTTSETVNVYVDRELVDLCHVSVPHFAFDSAALSDSARDSLGGLADCFVNGAAADQRLSLVGHADPRGTFDYNLALGERRAAQVAGYLSDQGVASSRLEVSSRGEMDATGDDPSSYAEDRRVGIFLAD